MTDQEWPRGTVALPVALVAAVALLQGLTWWLAPETVRGGDGKWLLSALEMGLLLVLLWNGLRIREALRADPVAGPVATLTFLSLAVCLGGDLVNRNLGGGFFTRDAVTEHAYLADSVWFFLPGYVLALAAAWRATASRVPAWLRAGSLAVGALAGLATFLSLLPEGTGPYVAALTGPYTVVISLLVPAGLWVLLAFGRAGLPVAIGCLLATVADALIGHFWLFGDGSAYPGVAYGNFVVYFLSQALVQQLPVRVARARA